jgi:hypothetical protein
MITQAFQYVVLQYISKLVLHGTFNQILFLMLAEAGCSVPVTIWVKKCNVVFFVACCNICV